MANFIRAANPVWYFVDLSGLGLNDQYYAHFLTNTMPYLPQPVYQDTSGNVAWSNPLQFFANGTLPNNLYFQDDLVYRIEIRKGPLQSDPLVYQIVDFIPGSSDSIDSSNIFEESNQITNPQFAQVSFNGTLTINSSGTYNIAPGWVLEVTGIGSTTIQQIVLNSNDSPPTPPYAIQFTSSGWSSVSLYQQFNGIGQIYFGEDPALGGAVTMSVTAKSSGGNYPLSLFYTQNSPGNSYQIASSTITSAGYQVLNGASGLITSANTNPSTTSYVRMLIVLPTSGTIAISNVQMIGQNFPLPPSYTITKFEAETLERQIDHTYHIFKDDTLIRSRNDILTGWNFPLNPFQFITPAITTVSPQTSYIADQTILYQTSSSLLQTGRASNAAYRNGLQIIPVTSASPTRFALIQYIDPDTIRPYWSYIVSCLIRARIFNESVTPSSNIGVKVRIIWRTSLPSTIGNTEPIASWASGSDPTFSAGWTAISPLNDPIYFLQNAFDTSEGTSAFPALQFNAFTLPDTSSQNMTLGIVVYTTNGLNTTPGQRDYVVFDKISLTPTHYAVDSDPKTANEVLQDCEFYYEKSFNTSDIPGVAITYEGSISIPSPLQYILATAVYRLLYTRFTIEFKTKKRGIPVVQTYDVTSASSDSIQVSISNGNSYPAASSPNPSIVTLSGHYQILGGGNAGLKNVTYQADSGTVDSEIMHVTAATSTYGSGEYTFHYTADARLGI